MTRLPCLPVSLLWLTFGATLGEFLCVFFFMVKRRFPPLLSLITNGCNDIGRLLSGQILIIAYKLLPFNLNSDRKGIYDFITWIGTSSHYPK